MNIFYYIIDGLSYLISLLPFKVLYIFSDIFFFFFYHLLRYRRKVVRNNLINSFPEKSEKEIKEIEKKFYASFCDYMVETIKLRSMSEAKMKRHMVFENFGQIEQLAAKGQSSVVYFGHFFSWEWIVSLPLITDDKNIFFGQIYHPLENKLSDRYFLSLRGRFGAQGIPMANTLRRIIELNKEKRPFVIGFIADQVPSWEAIKHWVPFLNRDTPIFTGTEKIARRTNSAAFYMSIERKKRGCFIARFRKITDAPNELPENAISEQYFQLLEENIRQSPHLWLWTHKRWKRTREGYAKREKKRAQDVEQLIQRNKNV